MENKKVSDAQLETLRGIHSQYEQITKQYGEMAYALELMKRAMHDLEDQRQIAIDALKAEMGSEGQVDLATGEFTPN